MLDDTLAAGRRRERGKQRDDLVSELAALRERFKPRA